MFNWKILLLTICLGAFAQAKKDSEVTKFMKFLQVIPDVIDEGPKYFLEITYDSGVKADKGVELTPTQVKHKPDISFSAAQPEAYYTLLMVDPDAPSRLKPEARNWLHWMVVNIPGDNLNNGQERAHYIGSGPPEGTSFHRYVFLLYKQSGKQEFDEPHLGDNSAEGRPRFSVADFVKKNKLGTPVAGNFYQAKWDDYVPILYKKLE